MKTEEFHKPFIKNLILIAVVTMFAMASGHYIVHYYFNYHSESSFYTSSESDIVTKTNK